MWCSRLTSTKVNHVLYVCLCLLQLTKLNANYRTTPGISLTGGDSSFKDIFWQPDGLRCTAAFMQSSRGCDWQGDDYCWEGIATRVVSVKSIYMMWFWWNYYQIIPEQHFSAAVDFFKTVHKPADTGTRPQSSITFKALDRDADSNKIITDSSYKAPLSNTC